MSLMGHDYKNEYKIEVFFDTDLTLNQGLDLFNKILLVDGVEEGVFIDKETASQIFKKEFNEDIFNIVGENPLPMGAIIGISEQKREFSSIDLITKEIQSMNYIDDAIYPQQAIIKFDRIIRNISSFAFIIALFIILVSYFFVSNTILLTIHAKKNEIKTMKLLGASNSFIKMPYIINGFLLGMLGSSISVLILILVSRLFSYVISPYYELTLMNYQFILIFNLVLGSILGVVSSSRALSIFVKNN
jgi:cell division transport system permease protein